MKNISLKGLVIFIVGAIFTFLLAYGVNHMVVKFGQVNPLEEALNNNKGIKAYRIDSGKKQLDLHLEFSKDADFKTVYHQVFEEASSYSKGKEVVITFENSSADFFKEVLFDIEPILYEGLATGKYTWMLEQVKEVSSKKGFQSKIQIDRKALYLHLTKDEHTYYHIIPQG